MSERQEDKSMRAETALTVRGKEPGFWRELWQQMRLVLRLLRDPEVPFYLKLLPFAAVLYVVFPFDLLTDLVPVIGQLDDVTALLVISKVFIELAPPGVVARHMLSIRRGDGYLEEVETDTGENDIADAIIVDAEHEIVVEDDADQG
jgi:uncharacterized membrane protein YkvA (DUF1232 family)